MNYSKAVALFIGLVSGRVSRLDTFDEAKNRIKFGLRGLLALPSTLRWLAFVAARPALLRFIELRPRVAAKLHRPYMLQSLGARGRVRILLAHYGFQCAQVPARLNERLLAGERVVLAHWAGKNGKMYEIVLAQWHSFEKEGEWSLRLGEAGGPALATLTCSVYQPVGEPVLLVGGLQGPRQSVEQGAIKEATKACYGLFPKKLVSEAVMELARQLGLAGVHAVSKEAHIYTHWRYGKEFQADYNQFWQELGAERLSDAVFKLPAEIYHKPLAEVESKKRSEYTKRYALLDEMKRQLKEVVCAA